MNLLIINKESHCPCAVFRHCLKMLILLKRLFLPSELTVGRRTAGQGAGARRAGAGTALDSGKGHERNRLYGLLVFTVQQCFLALGYFVP